MYSPVFQELHINISSAPTEQNLNTPKVTVNSIPRICCNEVVTHVTPDSVNMPDDVTSTDDVAPNLPII